LFQDLPPAAQNDVLIEAAKLSQEAEEANADGRAANRAWPGAVLNLNSGGLAFYSQLGVVRRPDLTQYFIDGFDRNRDALAFDETNQALFAEVLNHITRRMKEEFDSGDGIVQTDRSICDAPDRSYHARQLLFGTNYLQIPIMWRHLTFDISEAEQQAEPDILEVSIPNWLDDLGMDDDLKRRVEESGLAQLVFKAPTKGLSLHLGFDYVGEHKMGPLSIAMFQVRQRNGLAIQAALSMARAKELNGATKNTALITIGPSLHGKSTLTIMLELANSELAQQLGLVEDSAEGVYPMNDDIVLLQPLEQPVESLRGGNRIRISHGIDGTENNLYAMPFGLDPDDDPITHFAIRGTSDDPNTSELLENVPVNPDSGSPDFLRNPVRNMRVILSRQRLIARKRVQHVIEAITNGRVSDSVHVPMEDTDQVFWQEVMRQNTVIPPLRRLSLEQYVRVLMYGEAVQMGAAIGAIGRPYIEYFSDPFIIGLEDEIPNLMYFILQQMSWGGMPQRYYVFNTGGVGADSNEEASGPKYKKISKELTLMLQEALIRDAVKFEYDSTLRSEVAVAIVNESGKEVVDLRSEWLPRNIYGEDEYISRVMNLRRLRYFGADSSDKAGILRYTKVTDNLIDPADVPPPANERELAWLLSFYWNVDQAYDSLAELSSHRDQGLRPAQHLLRVVQQMYESGTSQSLELTSEARAALVDLGVRPR
jgi:ATP-dependent phosphoenolpyruvate carboxykinase